MKPVESILCVLLVWGLQSAPARCDESVGHHRVPASADNLMIVAADEGFVVLAFVGAVPMRSREKAHRPGLAILHSDLARGEASWLIRGGTFERPTRRISFVTRRVIGVRQQDSLLYLATWENVWWDRPPAEFTELPSDAGSYIVQALCLVTGLRVFRNELDLAEGRPDQIPVETAEPGVLENGELGVRIFGQNITAEKEGAVCA